MWNAVRELNEAPDRRAIGLGTAANLRIQLKRGTGLTPSDYRRRFALRSVS